MNKIVTVKSTVNATIGLVSNDTTLKRTWMKKGAIQKIPFEALEQAIYEPGIEYLFKSGILYIDDMEQKIALGLEEEDTTEPTNIIGIDSDEEALRVLTGIPFVEFQKIVGKLSYDQARDLAGIAIQNKITDRARCTALTKKSGINVLEAVSKAIKEEAEDEAAALA